MKTQEITIALPPAPGELQLVPGAPARASGRSRLYSSVPTTVFSRSDMADESASGLAEWLGLPYDILVSATSVQIQELRMMRREEIRNGW